MPHQHQRPIGPVTNAAAPFSPEMVQGAVPTHHHYRAPSHQGVQWWTPEVDPFSIEMVQGARPPDRSRGYLPVRVGWSVSQTTHTAASFSIEMITGVTVPQKRYTAPFHLGAQWWTPEVEAFSIEMVTGWRPDSPRIRLAPRFQQTPTQTTPVPAPLSLEMTQGSAPLFQAREYGWRKLMTSVMLVAEDISTVVVSFQAVASTSLTLASHLRRAARASVQRVMGSATAKRWLKRE